MNMSIVKLNADEILNLINNNMDDDQRLSLKAKIIKDNLFIASNVYNKTDNSLVIAESEQEALRTFIDHREIESKDLFDGYCIVCNEYVTEYCNHNKDEIEQSVSDFIMIERIFQN